MEVTRNAGGGLCPNFPGWQDAIKSGAPKPAGAKETNMLFIFLVHLDLDLDDAALNDYSDSPVDDNSGDKNVRDVPNH